MKLVNATEYYEKLEELYEPWITDHSNAGLAVKRAFESIEEIIPVTMNDDFPLYVNYDSLISVITNLSAEKITDGLQHMYDAFMYMAITTLELMQVYYVYEEAE